MNLPVSLKTIANGLGLLLLIALVAPFVVYAVPAVVGAEYSFVVLTASMTPAIEPGDVVIIDERDPASIAEGDVITFVRGDNDVPVTHRVIGTETVGGGIAFETQGDANDAPDASLVPAENVLGAVMITIPYIGYVIQFAASPAGFITLVVIPFGLLAFSEIWGLYKARTGRGNDENGESAGEDGRGGEIGSETGGSESASDPGFVVTERTVQGAVGTLLMFVPYAGYVAYTLRSGLTIAVATGASLGLIIGIVLLVTSGDESDVPDETVDAVADDEPDGRDDADELRDGADVDDGLATGREDRPSVSSESFEEPVIEPVMDGGSTDEVGR